MYERSHEKALSPILKVLEHKLPSLLVLSSYHIDTGQQQMISDISY